MTDALHRNPRHLVAIAATLVVVLLTTRFGGLFGFPPSGMSTFWPPNAILLGALILLDREIRLACLLLAYPTYVVAELWIGYIPGQSLTFALANCVEVFVAYFLLDRNGMANRQPWKLHYATVLLISITIASVVGGLIGASGFALSGEHYLGTFSRWFMTDFVGFLIFTPVVLTLPDWLRWMRDSDWRDYLGAAASFVAVAVLSILAYGPPILFQRGFLGDLFLPIPLILWMALRRGLRSASLGLLIASVIALAYATNGFGLYSAQSPEDSALSLQIFITSIVISTLLVAVLSQERDAALETLNETERLQSEARYKAIVDNAIDAIVILDSASGKYIEANPSAARLFGVSIDELVGHYGPADFSPEFQPDGRNSLEAVNDHIATAKNGEFLNFEWTFVDANQ